MPLLSFVLSNWKKYLNLVRKLHNSLGMNQTDFAYMINIPPQRYSAWRHQKIKPQKKSVDKVHRGIIALLDKGVQDKKIEPLESQVFKNKLKYLKTCINLMDLDMLHNLPDYLFQSLVELPEFVNNIQGIPVIESPQADLKMRSPALIRLPLYYSLQEKILARYPWEHQRYCIVDKSWLQVDKEENECFALYVSENTHSERLVPGDLAIFLTTNKDLEEGEIGLFMLNDKETVIRKFSKIKNRVVLLPFPGSRDTTPLIEKLNFDEYKIYGKLLSFIGKIPSKEDEKKYK